MSVPLSSLPELISKAPPSCRILSRIPVIPTPTMPVDAIADRFSSGMPLPLSSTSTRTVGLFSDLLASCPILRAKLVGINYPGEGGWHRPVG